MLMTKSMRPSANTVENRKDVPARNFPAFFRRGQRQIWQIWGAALCAINRARAQLTATSRQPIVYRRLWRERAMQFAPGPFACPNRQTPLGLRAYAK